MKEHPILFSATMVRALLDGTKTQTRRVVKLNPADTETLVNLVPNKSVCCPYGKPGDRLWVRETTINVEDLGYVGPVYAESEEGRNIRDFGLSPSADDMAEFDPEDIKLRPSIFMKRSMSRITLEIIGVRVERLQEISEADAVAEGVESIQTLSGYPAWRDYEAGFAKEFFKRSAVVSYRTLWNSINTKRTPWESNPWVWVVEFVRLAA